MPGLHDYFTSVLGVPLASLRYIDADLVFADMPGLAKGPYEMAFGDAVMDVAEADGRTRFTVVGGRFHGREASVKGALPLRDEPLLKLSMIDVQQGDGLVLETPGGQLLFIDGGDNQLFARHVAARFAGSSADKPLRVDALVVTHGDADHFDGLNDLVRSETLVNTAADPRRERKRVFALPDRVLHNGIVKRPNSVAEKLRLGPVAPKDGKAHLVGLVDSPLDVPAAEMNQYFSAWALALGHWQQRRAALGLAALGFARVAHDRPAPFDFLAGEADMAVDVIGPLATQVGGQPALRVLGDAGQTINGHSIAFRLRYRNLRLMFTGDLNRASMAALREALPAAQLRSEVLKVPHHGSHDFDLDFLRDVAPVVSIVSSGDESVLKEHIHPRANLMSALGRVSRGDTGIIFSTELAAFFAQRGPATETHPSDADDARPFHAFERTNFGIVHIRSDGQRVLAFTHSGKRGMNEAYGFTVDAAGEVTMSAKLDVRRG